MGVKLKKFIIVLEKPAGVYRSGDVVIGQCVIQLDGEMHLNQLTIKLKGKARCSVPEGKSDITSSHMCIELVYKPGSVYSYLLGHGQHNIGFKFQLPPRDLPSSFEGEYGHIRYYLKGRIHKTGIFVDKVILPIHILTIQSSAFYSIQELTQNVQNSNHKTIGLFGKKPVTLYCQMERMGYNIGSSIPIICVIDNQSKKSMTLRATLKQKVSFLAEGQTEVTKDKLVVSVGSIIHPNSKQRETVTLVVPEIKLVNLNGCPIIKIRYLITVTLVISGSLDLHCELPVILTEDQFCLFEEENTGFRF